MCKRFFFTACSSPHSWRGVWQERSTCRASLARAMLLSLARQHATYQRSAAPVVSWRGKSQRAPPQAPPVQVSHPWPDFMRWSKLR